MSCHLRSKLKWYYREYKPENSIQIHNTKYCFEHRISHIASAKLAAVSVRGAALRTGELSKARRDRRRRPAWSVREPANAPQARRRPSLGNSLLKLQRDKCVRLLDGPRQRRRTAVADAWRRLGLFLVASLGKAMFSAFPFLLFLLTFVCTFALDVTRMKAFQYLKWGWLGLLRPNEYQNGRWG